MTNFKMADKWLSQSKIDIHKFNMAQGIHRQDHDFLKIGSKVISKNVYFWYLVIALVGGAVPSFGMYPHIIVLMKCTKFCLD